MPNSTDDREQPQGGDFFKGDIRSGLETIRRRLLDPSNRNRLLNFRHRDRSKSMLRVVDEVPDHVFSVLLDGKSMRFRPVPQPRRQDWVLDGPEGSGDNGHTPRAYQAPRLKPPTAREFAEKNGIPTSFDLSTKAYTKGDRLPARHADREMQTLHFPEDLEGVLRSIAGAARLAIEETGTNMLYVAMGFLEWYDSDASDQARFAPVVLFPARLERGAPDPQTHVYRYSVQHSGEDILANISLQEKMRRDFALEFPDFDQEEDTPEHYFQVLDLIIKRHGRWRVRRQMTLALLAFGKLLMYRDLDPDTWPQGKRPENHPRLREFFEGIQQEEIGIAPDYPLDGLQPRGRIPIIIDDADASQHSALIDAVEGKNLVIQGPPGTGKSQTITNLIAVTIAAGKSVLFVAEKLAALEVVRDRLNRAGLGIFCLELHSHRTRKRALIEDIKARIEAHGQFREPDRLRGLREFWERTKRQLIEYAELVNSPWGQLGNTIHELLWWCRRRKTELAKTDALERLTLRNATSITAAEAEERRQLLRALGRHLTRVSSTGAVSQHPWFGVTNAGLDFLSADALIAAVEEVYRAAGSLLEWRAGVESEIGAEVAATPRAAVDLAQSAAALPGPPDGILPDILPALNEPSVARHLEEFDTRLREYRDLRATIVGELGGLPSWDPTMRGRLSEAVSTLLNVLKRDWQFKDERGVVDQLTGASGAIRTAWVAAEKLSRCVGEVVPFTTGSIRLLAEAFEGLSHAPVSLLHLRHEGLESVSAPGALEAALREAAPLLNMRDRLSQRFALELAPEPAAMRRHAAAVATSHWWSFIDPAFRSARSAYLTMYRDRGKPKRAEIKSDLQEFAAFQARVQGFAANRSYQEVGGKHFRGIDTPFADLEAVTRWRGEMARRLPPGSGDVDLGYALWRTGSDRLGPLAAEAGDLAALVARARNGIGAASELLKQSYAPASDKDLREFSSDLASTCARLTLAIEVLDAAAIPPTLRVGRIPPLVESVRELHRLWKALNEDQTAARVLDGRLREAIDDFGPVVATLAFHADLVASNLLPPLKQWLLEADVLSRLATLREVASDAGRLAVDFQGAWTRLENLAALDRAAWYPDLEVERQDDLNSVKSRAARALDGRDRLLEWLDYLQARTAARAAHLNAIVEVGEAGTVTADQLVLAFDFILSNSLVKAAFRQKPALAQFSGLTHEQLRVRFGEVDREIIKLERERVGALLDQRRVPMGVGTGPVRQYSEYSLLEREMGKQKRHIPIRQLILRSGKALQALKPCFMMGPLSVAQYLPAGQLEFDLLVMDEASQLKPEDALGAICRAKQVVVVGDPMQLPPTSFFERVADDDEVEDENEAQALTDAESILDVASHLYRPARMLRWHYRSRHGSLIAFSNREFYNGNLIVFPSPLGRGPELGVKFVHVPHAVYENRRNVVEARTVVDRVFRHMRKYPGDSLGIATMNTTQRDVIANEIEERLKADPAAKAYVERHEGGLEPLFVKNLENVQGDERAVIYVSVTYGPNERGSVYQRFGPINGATGHRRLNVLFTRARKRLVVFSSLLSDQIRVESNSRWGVRALKGYLAFAQTGVLEQASFTGREPDSDFEVEVASALRERGFEVVAQLGVAGFFLDLAVKHPYRLDSFILGIECDGASYHSTRSARDRDRLRQQILEDLGWKIRRIWSPDWFKNSGAEVERIVREIEELAGEPPTEGTDEGLSVGGEEIQEPGSEALLPALSVEEARAELIALREKVIKPANARESECILRDEMITAFLAQRPRDRSEWIDRIPIDLRMETDFSQTEYLDAILSITGRIRS